MWETARLVFEVIGVISMIVGVTKVAPNMVRAARAMAPIAIGSVATVKVAQVKIVASGLTVTMSVAKLVATEIAQAQGIRGKAIHALVAMFMLVYAVKLLPRLLLKLLKAIVEVEVAQAQSVVMVVKGAASHVALQGAARRMALQEAIARREAYSWWMR